MNYNIAIDKEIDELESRLRHLRIARDVIAELVRKYGAKTPADYIEGGFSKQKKERRIGKPYKTAHGIIRNPGAAKRAREYIIEFLQGQSMPIKGKLIQDMLLTHGIKDTTMWKVLKDLRVDGIINWDTDTRLYSVNVPHTNKAVAS